MGEGLVTTNPSPGQQRPIVTTTEAGMNVFVFRPQGIPGDNVFSDWTELMTAMSSVEGRKMLEFDDSKVLPPEVPRCEIPPGTWADDRCDVGRIRTAAG